MLGGRSIAILTLVAACSSPPPRRLPPPRSLPPVVSAPAPDDLAAPTPCPAAEVSPADAPQAEVVRGLFDAFFRAHAAGRIDPNLVDAHGGDVSQQPLSTELVCPASLEIGAALPGGGLQVSVSLRAGADVVDTAARLDRDAERFRIDAASLDDIRRDIQILALRRYLRDHPEVDRFQIVDVPFGNDFAAPGTPTPRHAYRTEANRRLAFVRTAASATLCVLAARSGSTSTRSDCWRVLESVDRVVVGGEPIVVDDLLQVRIVLVAPPPVTRAEVVDVRLPATERRTVGSIEVRTTDPGPAWMGRPLGGVALGRAPSPRSNAWRGLPDAAEPPIWLAVASAVPWLRAEPVASPDELSAISITADMDERRRWLAVRSHGAWAVSDAIATGGTADESGMTSFDSVETGARLLGAPASLVAWSSDFHGTAETGAGAAQMIALRVDRDRLREQGRLEMGAVRVWRSDLAPVDPVAERRRGAAQGPQHWVAWRLLYEAAPVGPPGCVRVSRTRADVAHVTYDFQPLPGRPLVEFDPATVPASLRFGQLVDVRGEHLLGPDGFASSSCGASGPVR